MTHNNESKCLTPNLEHQSSNDILSNERLLTSTLTTYKHMFRYITLLRKTPDDKMKEIFDIIKATEDKPVVEPYRAQIYTYDIYNTIKMFSKWYEDNKISSEDWSDFVRNIHPFDKIKFEITSELLPKQSNKVFITNAFTKMYEFLTYFEPKLLDMCSKNKNCLTMYDIASAPGMFILAAEYFCNKRKIKLDWHASSAPEDDNVHTLTDKYGLFANNPERYSDCDVSSILSVMNVVQQHAEKYMLVTGDIGIDTDSSKHVELALLDVQYGQAMMALNLCAPGGMLYLKMFSLMTRESLLILDILAYYFEEVYICKPCTSRVVNQECYIIAVNKLDKKLINTEFGIEGLPLSRMSLQDVQMYRSLNKDIVMRFDIDRFNYRNAFSVYMLTKIKNMPRESRTIKDMNRDLLYKTFYTQAMKVLNVITTNGEKINYIVVQDEEKEKAMIKELQYEW